MVLPSNVGFGTVTGAFLRAVADSPIDADRDPEGVPVTDLQITFSVSISPKLVRDMGATPPVTIVIEDVKATVGPDGILVGPDGQPGIRLVATSDPDLQPTNFTWNVTFASATFPPISFSFALPVAGTVDLATVVQVPSSPGATLDAWLAAVSAATAARDAAQAAAASAAGAVEAALVTERTSNAATYLAQGAGMLTARAGAPALRDVLSVKDYGAKGDAVKAADAAVSGGSAVVTTALATSAKVGQYAQVAGAGASGGHLTSQIIAVSSTSITLNANAASSVSNAAVTVGSDDRPAFQAAFADAAALITATKQGVTVTAPAGSYLFATGTPLYSFPVGIPIPKALPARLTFRGAGRGVATVILSSGCINVFYLNRTADYDTFQNITLEDFDVDNNNVYDAANGNGNHVLIGSVPANSNQQNRLNYQSIGVHRVNGYGLPSSGANSKANQSFILLLGSQTDTNEATQTQVRNITVEDVNVTGGVTCVTVASFGTVAPGRNVYYDNIRYRRLRHTQTALPTSARNETSFYICGSGYGGYAEMVDCYSQGVADDGVEIGAMQEVVLDRVRVVDAFYFGFTFRGTHAPVDVESQKFTIRDCTATFTAAGAAAVTALGTASRGAVVWIQDGSNVFGTWIFDRFQSWSDGDSYAITGYQYPGIKATVPMRRLEIRSSKFRVSNYALNQTAAVNFHPVHIETSIDGAVVLLKDVHFNFSAISNPGSAGTFFAPVYIKGGTNVKTYLDIDGIHGEYGTIALTQGGSFGYLSLDGAGALTGRVAGVEPHSASVSGVGTAGITLNNSFSTDVKSLLTIERCNFANVFINAGRDFYFTAAAAKLRTRLRNNIWKNVPAGAAITPTGSVFSYQNLDGYDQLVTIAGGTVTQIQMSDPGAGATTLGATSGTFLVPAGWTLAVTYSSAPTMSKVPLW